MSAKLKIFLVLMLSIFATAVAVGVYKIANLWQPNSSSAVKEQQQIRASDISNQKNVESQHGVRYRKIPLTQLTSVLKGTDPAAVAINAFDTNVAKEVTRKVEVFYPQPNQAMVTITETNLDSESTPIKYRVKLTSFGRSLFVDSPPLWQIVWAGSSEECLATATIDVSTTACN